MQNLPEKKLQMLNASDLGEMLIDAVSRGDKKVVKSALKSGMLAYLLVYCCKPTESFRRQDGDTCFRC